MNGLTEERMCKIYSSYLLNELHNKHVTSRLVNTLDLGIDYEHIFILIPSNNTGYFLTDLTFSQFNQNTEEFSKLLENGYQSIDDNNLNSYLRIVTNGTFTNEFLVENIFYTNENLNKLQR